jgi:hypothetical protein
LAAWSGGIATQAGQWSGEDVETFIMLECFTGPRISDASTFDMGRLNGHDCFLRMHKSGKPLFTWLPSDLVRRLDALSKKTRPAALHDSGAFNTKGNRG